MTGKRELVGRKLIEEPPQAAPVESLIILAVLAMFTAHLLLGGTIARGLLTGIPLLIITVFANKALQLFHVSLFCTLWVLPPVLMPFLKIWPLAKVVPLALYGIIVVAFPRLRHTVFWTRPGRFGADIRLLVFLLVVVSGLALLVWDIIFEPDLSSCEANIPEMPVWVLPLAGIAFAMANAAVEEAIFRGIFLQALDAALGCGMASLIIQAVIFGWLHFSEVAFPRGISGAMMASAYALMLGLLRNRARGMLAPWTAHACADIVVFAIVVTSFQV